MPAWAEPTGGDETEDAPTLLVSGSALRDGDLEHLVALARAGRRVLIDQLPQGLHRIDGEEIRIVPTDNCPRHAACRNTGHPLV